MICNQLIYLKMITRTKGKINATFKSDDFYKEYKTQVNSPLPKAKYNSIRQDIYDELCQEIYKNGQYKFKFHFGDIQILKSKRKISYNSNGSINKINYKVDWKKTKEYWKEKYPGLTQEELKQIKGKTKIYCDSEWRLRIVYQKRKAIYINKNFLWFKPARTFSRGLKVFVDSNPTIDYKEK